MIRFNLRGLFGLISVIAAILALPFMLEPAILGCCLLALWRRTRTPFLIGASVVAFPAWLVAAPNYGRPFARPADSATAEQFKEWRANTAENRRTMSFWVLGAMLAGGCLASVVRHERQTTP